MTTTFESLEAFVSDFQYVDDEHDRIVLTVGLQATFYFWGGHRSDVRASIADCAQAYEAAYGGELRWMLHPDTQRRVDVEGGKWPSLRDYIATLDEDDSIEWYVSSSEVDESVGEYRYEIVTERAWQEGVISTFSFTLPREHPFDADNKVRFLTLFEFVADKLAPYHAHAGLAAVTSFEQEDWQSRNWTSRRATWDCTSKRASSTPTTRPTALKASTGLPMSEIPSLNGSEASSGSWARWRQEQSPPSVCPLDC